MSARWEHFEHKADIGVRGMGDSKEQAFEQAALALTAVITGPDLVTPRQCISVECDAMDDDVLLVEWLNRLVYEMATRNMLFSRFHVSINDSHLTASCCGEEIETARHHPAVEIKGATFTELYVGHSDSGWTAQTVVDV